MNSLKIISTSLLLLIPFLMDAQTFKYPTNANGTKVACEKFEQIEHYLKHKGKINLSPKPKENTSLTRSAGEVIVNTSNNEFELHAAVNPVDDENIIVGCIKFDTNNPLQGLSISLYSTNDGAETWTQSSFNGILSDDDIVFGGGDPIIVFDNDGVAHLTWLLVSAGQSTNSWGIYYATSSDGGINWTTKDPVIESEFTDLFALSDLDAAADKQWMVADNELTSPHHGNVYVAYTNIKDVVTTAPIYEITFQKKTPGQESFDEDNAVVLNTGSYTLNQFTSIDTDREGNIYVTFLSHDALDPNIYTIHIAKSIDGGNSFEVEQKVQDFNFAEIGNSVGEIVGIGGQRLYPSPHVGIDKSGGEYDGRIYVAYTSTTTPNSPEDGYDIYLTISDDKGDSWSTPRVVNDDNDPLAEQFYSAINVSKDGYVSLAWYDGRDAIVGSSDINYFLGVSKDGGDSFEQFAVSSAASDFSQIGSLNQDFGIGEYNQVVSAGDYIIPFWADGRNNNGEVSIYGFKQDVNTLSSTEDGLVKINSDIFITSVSPNPASDILNIDVSLNKSLDLSYEVVDLSGQIVFRKENINLPRGNHILNIEVGELATGNYVFNLLSDSSQISKKVQVLK